MTTFFGFSPSLAAAVVAAALAYWVVALVPVIFASAVAMRRRQEMQRKLLFVGSVMALTYGFATALLAVVGVPIAHFMVFAAPAMRQRGYLENSWFVQAVDLAASHGSLTLAPVLVIVALLVTRYLAPRWNGIVSALKG